MARSKTNTQNDTKTRTTPWHNRHLEKKTIFLCFMDVCKTYIMAVIDPDVWVCTAINQAIDLHAHFDKSAISEIYLNTLYSCHNESTN